MGCSQMCTHSMAGSPPKFILKRLGQDNRGVKKVCMASYPLPLLLLLPHNFSIFNLNVFIIQDVRKIETMQKLHKVKRECCPHPYLPPHTFSFPQYRVWKVSFQTFSMITYSFFFFFNIFFFWLCWVTITVRGLSLVVANGGYCSLQCAGFSLWWPLVAEHGLQACRLQQLWLAGSRAQAQQLWHTGFVAPRHVGSSRPGLEPVSPALAGGFLTTASPGKTFF